MTITREQIDAWEIGDAVSIKPGTDKKFSSGVVTDKSLRFPGTKLEYAIVKIRLEKAIYSSADWWLSEGAGWEVQ